MEARQSLHMLPRVAVDRRSDSKPADRQSLKGPSIILVVIQVHITFRDLGSSFLSCVDLCHRQIC